MLFELCVCFCYMKIFHVEEVLHHNKHVYLPHGAYNCCSASEVRIQGYGTIKTGFRGGGAENTP